MRSLVVPLLPHILPLKLFLNFTFSDTRSPASQARLRLPIYSWGMFSFFSEPNLSGAAHAPRNKEWQGHLFPSSSGYTVPAAALGRVGPETRHPPTQVHPVGSTVSLITGGFQSREPVLLRSSISTSQPLAILSAWGFLVMWPLFGWLICLFLCCPSRLPWILPCLAYAHLSLGSHQGPKCLRFPMSSLQ